LGDPRKENVLENTFCHIPGIGAKTERELWNTGILTWETALDERAALPSARKRTALHRHAGESIARLERSDARYFGDRLPSREHWRLFTAFRHSVAYVDIETTGLGGPSDYITTIALYDGREIRTYVQGQNLDDFGHDIERYQLLITYNGKCFDVPFIRNDLGLAMDHAHIDLRYVLASIGHRGGLKGCERQLGIDRGDLIDIDGFFAVLLWQDYHTTGNARALETLLAYNILDVVNLEKLMVIAYNRKLEGTPFEETHRLPDPMQPANPFRADRGTIYRLRRTHGPYRW
jgi:uncharacterized protein YprB with RNaseH-like and TPR domain